MAADEPENETINLEDITFSKTRISDQVKEILKELVLRHKAGSRIPSEDEVARRLRVSKATVREALGHLEAQGLIERRRGVHGGSFVAKPTSVKMGEVVMNYYRMGDVTPENLAEFRSTFEPPLAMLAAERITDSGMEALKRNIESIESHLELSKVSDGKDAAGRAKALEFHALVADACQNPLFSHVMRAMILVFEKVLDQFPLDLEVARYDLDHCKQIYEAFQKRDGALAHELTLKHFKKLREYIANSQIASRRETRNEHTFR